MTMDSHITAVILAGGQGRRMDGADKGLLTFDGQPLVEHALAALRPQVAEILISANRNLERYRDYGCEVVRDPKGGSHGPLSGIVAALQNARSEYVLTVPCDAPFVSGDYAARMRNALAHRESRAAVAHDGERLQPVFSLLRRSLAAALAGYLGRGGRRARDFLLEQDAVPVDFSDRAAMFVNLNRPEDLDIVPTACASQ